MGKSFVGRPIVPSERGLATLIEMLAERNRMIQANPQTELGRVHDCARKIMHDDGHK
jgi:hypothetical protein